MGAFRISRIQLRDVRRHRTLDVALAPGLSVVKGPNEAGKSTLAEAIVLGLAPASGISADTVRSWGAPADAAPVVTLDFSADPPQAADGSPASTQPQAGQVSRTFGPAGPTTSLTIEGARVDPVAAEARLAELSGLSSAAVFRGTAFVGHAELNGLPRDASVRERLTASITAADRRTVEARASLLATLADLNTRADGSPGRIGVAQAAVDRSAALVASSDAALERLAADRASAVEAEATQAAASDAVARNKDLLEQARRAERLVAERDAASERANRYSQAITISQELATLATTHPSKEPLPILRQTVGRLVTVDARINELKRLLAGEVQVDFEAEAPQPTWRLPTIIGLLGILLGIGLAVAGLLVKGLTVLLGVGIGVALIGAGLVVFARRRRNAAFSEERKKQLADVQIDRRLRGRSQLENELKEAEADYAQQLKGIAQPDLATAQAELAAEEAHVAKITDLTGQLEKLVGRDAVETFPASRDAALAAAAGRSADLAKLAEPARAEGATAHFEAEVGSAEAALETARQAAATARAAADANPVDSDQAAREAERLAAWRTQLDLLHRRGRVAQVALDGLNRAETATTARTSRYVERRVNGSISQMTGGRYRRVTIDDTTMAVRAFSADRGDWVPIEDLSDGTAEQILLAARIGLLGYVTGGQLPPLVLDDPFAGYDDARAARSMGLLRELAKGQQIVYLTASGRFDAGADVVIELDGPSAVDGPADGAAGSGGAVGATGGAADGGGGPP
jgi:AAA domain